MTAELETRARAAAAGLRRVAADRVPPEWAPPGPRRGSRARIAVVVAVAAVGLLAIGVLGRALVTGEDRQPVASGSDGVPELVPDVVPDGLTAKPGIDLPRPEPDLGPERMTVLVYGDPTAADPLAAADLAVTVFRSDAVEPAALGDSLTVRGKPGWVSTDGAGRTALMWQEAPGVLGLVTSGTLDQAAMAAVADGLAFGEEVTVGVTPAGLSLVGALDDAGLTGVILPSVLPATTDGHITSYEDETGDRTLVVATLAPEPEEVLALRWMLGADAGETTVRGHPARAATQADGVHALLWEEAPGLYVVVGGNVGVEAVTAAAESVRPA